MLYQLGQYVEKFIEPDQPPPLDTRFRGHDGGSAEERGAVHPHPSPLPEGEGSWAPPS